MSADDLSLAEVRQELHRLVALADSAERPAPTRINPSDHPMPGHEWSVTAHMPKALIDHYYRRERDGWLIRATDSAEDGEFIYVSTPDAMDAEDFMPIPTPSARKLATALLAACDRADAVRLNVSSLAARRATKNFPSQKAPGRTSPSEGDRLT